MIYKFRRICLLVLLSLSFLYSQDKVVAEIGRHKIYESEFRERFDFSAHPKLLQNDDSLLIKHKFLEQLIAEKLLSLEAQNNGYDSLKAFTDLMIPLQNIFVRDALYKTEVTDKAVRSKDDIISGINRIQKKLKIKFMYSKDANELQNLYLDLKKGDSFDSLLSLRAEAEDQNVPKEVTFGTMDKKIEDLIYNLQIGEFTPPVASNDGYYILKLVGVGKNYDLKSNESTLDDVKRIVETRANHKRYLDYYHKFFSKYKITADKEIFGHLIKYFVPAFKTKYANQTLKSDKEKPNLSGSEVSSAINSLNKKLIRKTFINVKQKPVRAEYFLNQLGQEGFYVNDLSEFSIRSSLSSYIRKFIEDQLLTNEAIKRGLENLPEVKKYLDMWKDSYLAKMRMVNMFDSLKVTNEEAYNFYKQSNGKNLPLQQVNIAEVLTDSLSVAEVVLNKLTKGEDIKSLAVQYTIRDSLKSKGGVFGFFPITKYGDIGKNAAHMKIGDICGPIKVNDGYSIFQLIDRKEDTTNYSMSYDEIKDQIVMQLTLDKFEKYVNEYNAKLANKYGVKIHDDVLASIDDIFMNLVVVRKMGFGGEVYAVPYTEQFDGWYDIWKNNNNINP